jgi:hypothetical protein
MPIATQVSPTILGMSKTSVNGVLALLITILSSLMAYQIPAALMNPNVNHIWLWVTAIANLITGILRALVGFLQADSSMKITN